MRIAVLKLGHWCPTSWDILDPKLGHFGTPGPFLNTFFLYFYR